MSSLMHKQVLTFRQFKAEAEREILAICHFGPKRGRPRHNILGTPTNPSPKMQMTIDIAQRVVTTLRDLRVSEGYVLEPQVQERVATTRACRELARYILGGLAKFKPASKNTNAVLAWHETVGRIMDVGKAEARPGVRRQANYVASDGIEPLWRTAAIGREQHKGQTRTAIHTDRLEVLIRGHAAMGERDAATAYAEEVARYRYRAAAE